MDKKKNKTTLPQTSAQAKVTSGRELETPLVVRSTPPSSNNYHDYLDPLRDDFFYLCAYCTLMEVEAAGISFEIDHYEPETARPDLKCDYENLMYSCAICNSRKSDRSPPPTARLKGHRFFRPDQDIHTDHFELSGIRLNGKTTTGQYTIDAIDLNRNMLNKLRGIRTRAIEAQRYVAEGLAGLRNFPIDRLPPQIRGKALVAIRGIDDDADAVTEKLNRLLKSEARSSLIDRDTDASLTEEDRARKKRLKGIEALFGGSWRGRNQN